MGREMLRRELETLELLGMRLTDAMVDRLLKAATEPDTVDLESLQPCDIFQFPGTNARQLIFVAKTTDGHVVVSPTRAIECYVGDSPIIPTGKKWTP